MAQPVDFIPIALHAADEKAGRARMREMLGRGWWRKRGKASWAGFAAEPALCRAWNGVSYGRLKAELAPTLACDLVLGRGTDAAGSTEPGTLVEVKTRTVESGWCDPRLFQWLVIPTHDGREPIKQVDLVWFNWFSLDQPRRLWVLGFLRGPEEFQRRAVFYREGEPLPRGGWAGAGGAWAIEIKQLRPFPRGAFKECDL